MYSYILLILSIPIALGETGLYSLLFSFAILALSLGRILLLKRQYLFRLNWAYIAFGSAAILFYSFGSFSISLGDYSVLNAFKSFSFFLETYLIFSFLADDIIYYLLGIGVGSAVYPVVLFFHTIQSPYSWKIQGREFLPLSFSGSSNPLEQVFYNSLDFLQSSSLGLALGVLTLALSSQRLSLSRFRIFWVLYVLCVASSSILSILLQSRSAFFFSVLNFVCLFFLFPALKIAEIYSRSLYIFRQTVIQRVNLINLSLQVSVFLLFLVPLWDSIHAYQISFDRATISNTSRDLFGARSDLFAFGFTSIIKLTDPADMQSFVYSIFGNFSDKTFHNIFIDQYYNSDLLGLLMLFAFLFPFSQSLYIIAKRIFFGKTFSVYNTLFVSFSLILIVVMMTSSPLKPVYGVTFIVSIIFTSMVPTSGRL